jgi:hypothetical protein
MKASCRDRRAATSGEAGATKSPSARQGTQSREDRQSHPQGMIADMLAAILNASAEQWKDARKTRGSC